MADLDIIPECYVDTNLIETLVCHDGCNHQKGCNQVACTMQNKFQGRFALGIMDADKRQSSYVKEFDVVARSTHLLLLRHPASPHYIVMVSPAIDGFILDTATLLGVDVSKFGLNPDLKKFTSVTKRVTSKSDERFKSLFRALKGAKEVQTLANIISYLRLNRYSADSAILAGMF